MNACFHASANEKGRHCAAIALRYAQWWEWCVLVGRGRHGKRRGIQRQAIAFN